MNLLIGINALLYRNISLPEQATICKMVYVDSLEQSPLEFFNYKKTINHTT